jgi:hypothetical protein
MSSKEACIGANGCYSILISNLPRNNESPQPARLNSSNRASRNSRSGRSSCRQGKTNDSVIELLQHQAIVFFQDIAPDVDHVVVAEADHVGVICRGVSEHTANPFGIAWATWVCIAQDVCRFQELSLA